LGVETAILSLSALGCLIYWELTGTAAFGHSSSTTNILLLGAGVVTALPLLWFANAVKILTLTTIGFFQYVAPTCMFLLGVFVYHEPFTKQHLITFALIWTGLILYSLDSIKIKAV